MKKKKVCKKIKKTIIPERKRCEFGAKVKNHHWLCDKCYSKKQKEKYKIKRQKLLYSQRNNKVVYKKLYNLKGTKSATANPLLEIGA